MKRMCLIAVLLAASSTAGRAEESALALAARPGTPVVVTRLYTGTDGQTHAEEVELKLTKSGNTDGAGLLPVTGAEVHRHPAGSFSDWHQSPRRQYVITISGHGEIELAGGQKIPVGPGHIDLVEDTTGKGHITRNAPDEDRITIWLPIADQDSH